MSRELKMEVVFGRRDMSVLNTNLEPKNYATVKVRLWINMMNNDRMRPIKWFKSTKKGTKVNVAPIRCQEDYDLGLEELKRYITEVNEAFDMNLFIGKGDGTDSILDRNLDSIFIRAEKNGKIGSFCLTDLGYSHRNAWIQNQNRQGLVRVIEHLQARITLIVEVVNSILPETEAKLSDFSAILTKSTLEELSMGQLKGVSLELAHYLRNVGDQYDLKRGDMSDLPGFMA